ncbi:MAG TPA: AgmX/PglI C-terminal domain-containing protein, partial [Polyangia bacterium]
RGAVRELRGVVGQRGSHDRGYRRSLLTRPGFWLLLLLLGGVAYGLWRWKRVSPPAAEEVATAEAEPVATNSPRSTVRRQRPRRSSAPANNTAASPAPANDAAVVIRKNQSGVRMCYERALKRDARLSHLRLDVRLNVTAAGVVDRVSLAGLPDGTMLSNCIQNTIRTWKFSPVAGGYETTFSLHLQSTD